MPTGYPGPGPGCSDTSYSVYIQRVLRYEEGSIQADQIIAFDKDQNAWKSLKVACSAAEA